MILISALMSKLKEEIQVTGYIVKEKLSRDLIQLKRQHEICSNVANDNYISKATLESLGANVRISFNAI